LTCLIWQKLLMVWEAESICTNSSAADTPASQTKFLPFSFCYHARHFFRLPDKSAKTVKQAADALLQANPQLKNLSKVPVGAVIDIPSTTPPLNPSEEVPAIVTRQVGSGLQAQQLLDVLDQRLSEIDARAADAANALLSVAQSKQAQALAEKSPDLNAKLPALIASAKSTAEAVKAQQAARSRAVAELHTRLQSFPQTKG
jgi:hypothetical protein